jgi:hypothetical protein
VIFIPHDIRDEADALIPQPDYRFSSDGCSGGMSWAWRAVTGRGPPWEGCCVTHDRAYWAGGTRDDRRAADRALRRCVIATACEYALMGERLIIALAWLIWAAVRIGGVPWLPTRYRWGFGWHYPRGYDREK